MERLTKSSPNQVFINTAERSAKISAKDQKRKATEAVKEQRRKSKYANKCNTPAAHSTYSRHDRGILPDQVTRKEKTADSFCGELQKWRKKLKKARKYKHYYIVRLKETRRLAMTH